MPRIRPDELCSISDKKSTNCGNSRTSTDELKTKCLARCFVNASYRDSTQGDLHLTKHATVWFVSVQLFVSQCCRLFGFRLQHYAPSLCGNVATQTSYFVCYDHVVCAEYDPRLGAGKVQCHYTSVSMPGAPFVELRCWLEFGSDKQLKRRQFEARHTRYSRRSYHGVVAQRLCRSPSPYNIYGSTRTSPSRSLHVDQSLPTLVPTRTCVRAVCAKPSPLQYDSF
jgi:hypothetical protein